MITQTPGHSLHVLQSRWQNIGVARPLVMVLLLLLTMMTSRAQDSLVGWGDNAYGKAVPPALPAGVGITDVSPGIYYFSLAVTTQGQAIGWGNNSWGNFNVPALPAGVTYTKVAAGQHHGLALRSDGQVVAFGNNSYGELNVPALPAGLTYTEVGAGYLWSAALRSDGRILVWGYNGWNQQSVPSLPAVVVYTALTVNYQFGLALRSDGQIVGFGANSWSNLNAPALPAGVTYTKVSAGYHHSLALRSDGQAVAFGNNSYGETTVPALAAGETYKDVAAGYLWSLALKSNGQVVGFGYNGWGNLNIPSAPAGSVYTKIFAGQTHGLGLLHQYVNVSLNGSGEQSILLGSTFTDPGATATDDDGNTLTVTATGTVNPNILGSYVITYSATDSDGNSGNAVRTVHVVKKLPSELWTALMPSYSQSQTYANAALNEPITVWGRAWNGTAPYSYTLDYGDGTTPLTGNATAANSNFIGASHTYTSTGSKTVTLTVTDANGQTVTRAAVIRVLLSPTHGERVNMAIEKGLLHLYRKQIVKNNRQTYWWADDNNEYRIGTVASAVLSFAENGHLASNDYEQDIYAETVHRGLNWLVSKSGYASISTTVAGQDPDSDGNGKGIAIPGTHIGHHIYAHSFATMAAIMSFPNPQVAGSMIIPADVNAQFSGLSYQAFVMNALDMLNYSQSENWGGWHYDLITSSSGSPDGSTHQWPNLAYLFAKDRWGYTPLPWVVSRSAQAIKNLQNANGGIGYSSSSQWLNVGKTGGGLVALYLGSELVGDDNVDRAIGFISQNWFSTTPTSNSGSPDGGWIGEFYAMYGVKKGLQLQEVTTVTTPNGNRDWYNDMSGWLLANTSLIGANLGNGLRDINAFSFGQKTDGSWENSQWPVGNAGAPNSEIETAHAILILTKSLTKPLPVAVVAAVPDQSSKAPAPFTLNGSGSYHLDPNATIVEWLWVIDGGQNPNWNSPIASGQSVSINPGWNTPGVHTATLRVKDNQNPANYAVATITINVLDTDVAPVAVPIPASRQPAVYTGQLGETIELDGSESYDPEGDPIISYAWDLDGNGTYGDAADAAKDSSGNNAQGVTASLVYTAEFTGQIGLKVTSQPVGGLPKSSNNQTSVDVQASPSDLTISSITAANVALGSSADVTVVVQSAAGSSKDANNVQLKFYNGDPFAGGSPIGTTVSLSIPKETSVSITASVPLAAGQEFVWAYIDSTLSFAEYNEQNNTASVNVGNKAPVAQCQDVTVSAGPDGTAAASINNGSYDSDPGDGITVVQTPEGPFAVGVHQVSITVTDSKGLSSSCQATVTVVDDSAPQIVDCPADQVIYTGIGRTTCDQVATWTAPTANDNVGVASFTKTHESGTAFPVGTTVVTYTAQDAAGNQVTCSFSVTVIDNTAPVISNCPENVVVNTAGRATCDQAVLWEAPGADDNCALQSLTSSHAPGSVFPIGTTVVTYLAVDTAGNQSSCSFTVTVLDGTAPVIVDCPENIVVQTGPGRTTCDQVASWTPPTAFDNCTLAALDSTHQPGEVFPVGSTVVTYIAVDAAGNQTECSFTVTVQDNTAPVVAAPADLSVAFGAVPAAATSVAEYLAIGGAAADNCGLATVTSSDSTTGLCPTIVTRTYVITDIHGNSTTIQQTITVNNVFAADGVLWHQPLARNGASDDSDPSAGGTLWHIFKLGNSIPVKIHALGCEGQVTGNGTVTATVSVYADANKDGVPDGSPIAVTYNGSGAANGGMVKVDGFLRYNLETKNFPAAARFFILRVTVTDNATGESRTEQIGLQAR